MTGPAHEVAPELAALHVVAAERRDDVLHQVVDRVRAEFTAFAAISRREHEHAVGAQLDAFLAGLREGRRPSPHELEQARDLGRRRAQQLIPLEAVIGAFHTAHEQLWALLRDAATARDPASLLSLLTVVDQAWMYVRHMCGAVADGYSETSRSRQADQVALRHRFLDTLYSGGGDREEAVFMARALEFEPDGTFQAACAPASAWSEPHFEALRWRLRRRGCTVHATLRSELVVILLQGVAVESVEDLLPPGADGVLGVGLPRPGPAGAMESIGDAERALVVARQRAGRASFDAEWLIATLIPHRDRLAPLLCSPVPARHPHLAEAVLAYARHGFSITASGAALHVHPNTIAYRLDRWRRLTGWDPRTWDGLARSLAGMALYPQAGRPDPDSDS